MLLLLLALLMQHLMVVFLLQPLGLPLLLLRLPRGGLHELRHGTARPAIMSGGEVLPYASSSGSNVLAWAEAYLAAVSIVDGTVCQGSGVGSGVCASLELPAAGGHAVVLQLLHLVLPLPLLFWLELQ